MQQIEDPGNRWRAIESKKIRGGRSLWTVLLFFGAGVAKQMPKTICPRNKIPHRMNLQVKQNTQGPRNEIHHGPTVDPDASVQIPKTRYYIIFLARRGGEQID